MLHHVKSLFFFLSLLNLDSEGIGGATFLSEALKVNTTLTELKLSST